MKHHPNRYRLGIIVSSMLLFLTGCSLLSPVQNQSPATFLLTSVDPHPIHAKKTAYTLLVATPKASPGYASSAIVYVKRDFELQSFSKHSWIEPPSQMLLPLIVQSLQNTGHFKAVLAEPFVGSTNYRLDTQILSLQQEFLQKPSRIRLRMRAELLNVTTQKVIASKQFQVVEIAPSDTPYGGVIAANHAVAMMLHKVTKFCVARTSAH